MISSPYFKNKANKHMKEQIDADYLRIFGLLHCPGNIKEKALKLFCLLQEGGPQKHLVITASDKDIPIIIDKLLLFATVESLALASEFGGVEQIYSQDEC